MRLWLLAPTILALTACTSSQPMNERERFAANTSRCSMMGAKTDKDMFQCRLALEQSDQQTAAYRDESRRARQSAALLSFGNGILAQQAIQQANRPSTTTCNRYGNRVVCNTF